MAKTRVARIILGDIGIFYGALLLTLAIRYESAFLVDTLSTHVAPFSLVLIGYIAVFYAIGLYETRSFKNSLRFTRLFIAGIIASTILALIFFYLDPGIGIAPKTNLLLFTIIFGAIDYGWRSFSNASFRKGVPQRIMFLGTSPEMEKLKKYLEKNPQFGYEVNETNPTIIVLDKNEIGNSARIEKIYESFIKGSEVTTVASLTEQVQQKVPISELEKMWFIENIRISASVYEKTKSIIERGTALLLIVLGVPLMMLIAICVKVTSKGPAIYRQTRIGKKSATFMLYKFRTMYENAEQNGAVWAKEKDPRVTPVGRFLRRTHCDELPQLINIIKGNLAFTGHRPERPSFVEVLKEKIPYYEIRHMIRPGITGWAQIKYQYGSSIEDAREKLEYDLYYLKNRSLALDLAILIKTIKLFFVRPPQKSDS